MLNKFASASLLFALSTSLYAGQSKVSANRSLAKSYAFLSKVRFVENNEKAFVDAFKNTNKYLSILEESKDPAVVDIWINLLGIETEVYYAHAAQDMLCTIAFDRLRRIIPIVHNTSRSSFITDPTARQAVRDKYKSWLASSQTLGGISYDKQNSVFVSPSTTISDIKAHRDWYCSPNPK